MPPDEANKVGEGSAKAVLETPAVHHTAIASESPVAAPQAAASAPASQPSSSGSERRRWVLGGVGIVVLVAALYFGLPIVLRMLRTVSTDDAYVNGHATFVAPRVAGQVMKVLVDDNNRVAKGDLLVQLDKEPYQVQRNLKQAAVELAQADVAVTEDEVRASVAEARGNRFKLAHAIELVDDQVAQLRATVAAYESQKATLALAQANLARGEKLAPTGSISKEDLDQRVRQAKVGEAEVKQALEQVYQIRVGLGLPAQTKSGDLTEVPADLDQNFSTVRQALAELLQSAAPLGLYPPSYDALPKTVIEDFYKRDPQGNLDRIYAKLIHDAPKIKQAHARLLETERDLAQSDLNLRYCDVFAEIDGVVTRRNVNPGNNVQAGQSLMVVRSLTEIWIDANFKETQLANLRIGQRTELEVDMYGRRLTFEGRITGFTMGTGSTLSLLPAQNATGNFIKVVQRLPVRIELTDYNPDKQPLFIGLSVIPHVFFKEAASGPHAGAFLQPALLTEPASAPESSAPASSTPASSAPGSKP